jgi:putative membrane protein
MAGDRGLSFVVVGLITLSALWVTITRGSYPSRAANAAKDAAFLQFAAERHRAEVLIAELAMKRATTSALKQLAARMVADYAQRLGELNRIAFHKGIRFPAGLNAADQASYDYLATLNASEFDQWYADHTLRRQNAALAEFQDEAAHGTQPEIKQFAKEMLVTVEEHLRLIQDTTAQIAIAAASPVLGFL